MNDIDQLVDLWGLSEEHVLSLLRGKKLNVTQAAAMLGVERRAVYEMITQGDFPAFRLNKSLRIPERSIIDFVARKLLQKSLE